MFYIPFIVVLLFGIGVKKSELRNKYFCIITGFVYFLLAALRSPSVGNDTQNYVNNLINFAGVSLSRLSKIVDKDLCFYWFLSILGRLTDSYTVLFAIVAGWFGYSVWHFIRKYSPDMALSIIMLLALNLYQFSLTGMRQTIAMGFVLWAFDLLLQKRNLKASVFILIGSLFHMSALATLVMIPINMFVKRITRRRALAICGLLAAVFMLRNYIASVLILLIADRGYSLTEADGGLTMTFVIFVLLVISSIFISEFSAKDKNAAFLFLCGAVASGFQMLVATQPIFFRFGFYFLMVYPVLIPLVINSLRIRGNYRFLKRLLYVLMSVQYLFFTVNSCGISPYHFFWESV